MSKGCRARPGGPWRALQMEKAGTPKRSRRAQQRWSGWQLACQSYGIGRDMRRAGFGEPFSAEQPSVMPSALPSLEEELIWALEVNFLQSTDTSSLKYLPARELPGVRGESQQH